MVWARNSYLIWGLNQHPQLLFLWPGLLLLVGGREEEAER